MASANSTAPSTQGAAATGTDTTPQELVVVLNPLNLDFSEFLGSRATLEAEGIIPKGTDWPEGYASLRWQDGKFDYWLIRQRPPGAKGPRRTFIDVDWFCLRWELTGQPSWDQREIQRKEQELKEAIYRRSAKGVAEWDANWNRYRKAKNDKQFQTFMASIPGLVPAKRGCRAGQQVSTA